MSPKRLGLIVGVILAVVLIAMRAMYVAFDEQYSHQYASRTSAEAEANGILVARPVLSDPSITIDDAQVRVIDAWYEEETRREAVMLLFQRTVRLNSTRLLVQLQRPASARPSGKLAILPDSGATDTVRFDGKYVAGDTIAFAIRDVATVRDTLRLHWLKR